MQKFTWTCDLSTTSYQAQIAPRPNLNNFGKIHVSAEIVRQPWFVRSTECQVQPWDPQICVDQ